MTVDRIIGQLIGAAMFGRPLSLPEKTDWEAVYEEARAHGIAELFAGILPSLPLPEKLAEEWRGLIYHTLIRDARLRRAQGELREVLRDVPYVILKGTAAAIYYPDPYSRRIGDIDFLVPEEDYGRAKERLLENGFQAAFEYEDDYRHESFEKGGFHFECHHSFASRARVTKDRIDACIASRIKDRVFSEQDPDHPFPVLPDPANGLVLLEHIAIHLESGIGFRQIIDWMMFVDRCLHDAEWNGETGRIIRETGLDRIAKTVTAMCQKHLGLDGSIAWPEGAEYTEELFGLLYSYGDFGRKNELDNRIVRVMSTSRRGFFKNLKLAGEDNWKALRKHPWLRPLAPVYQIGRYGKQLLTTKGALRGLRSKRARSDVKNEMLKALRLVK